MQDILVTICFIFTWLFVRLGWLTQFFWIKANYHLSIGAQEDKMLNGLSVLEVEQTQLIPHFQSYWFKGIFLVLKVV